MDANEFWRKTTNSTDVWLTPKYIIDELGPFDLDPCSPQHPPWPIAKDWYSLENNQDGLSLPWTGTVWLNPPYSNWSPFVKKLSEHGNGIALIFAKTETKAFHEYIWGKADGLLFLKRRLKFHKPNGEQGQSATQPSVLIAYGESMAERLRHSKLSGFFVKGKIE